MFGIHASCLAADAPILRARRFIAAAGLAVALLPTVALADPVGVGVNSYVHDGVRVFDGVEHIHPYGSKEQHIPALSSALWTVDITSGPPADQQWQYSLTIDYWDFGLPSYASFPFLDINLDIKEPGTSQPITDFKVVNGNGEDLVLDYGAIIAGGRIECTLNRSSNFIFNNIVTVYWNQGIPGPELTDITVTPVTINLTPGTQVRQLVVTGIYSDGSQQDLTPGAAGTKYHSASHTVACVDHDGRVLAVWNGATTVEVSNGGFTKIANINVAVGSYPADGNHNNVIDEADLCEFLQNPIDLNGDGVANDVDWDLLSELLEDVPADCNGNGTPDVCDISSGASADCNANGIPDDCEADCNNNGVADTCDISGGASADCNNNGVPDSCDIASGAVDINSNGVPDSCEPDCNSNGVPDAWDISTQYSEDCDGDGVPDECGIDCNSNGVADSCDISSGTSGDCNGNGIPDLCDIASGFGQDANGNGIPDTCEADCNENGFPDAYDIAIGTSADCNHNGSPDECETDCNNNNVPDDCDIAGGTSADCNNNGVPDSCDIAGGALDLNHNGVPDVCESDCNSNGRPDDLDIADGISGDCNNNDIPDECDPDCNSNGIPDGCEGIAQLATLVPSDNPPGSGSDNIALSGNYAVLGSSLDDTRGNDAGAVYVFELNGSAWTMVAKLVASDGAAGDQFGRNVSISDDVLVVGARLRGDSTGAAYVFRRNNGVWAQETKLAPAELKAGDRFGVSVGVSGNAIVVGAERDDDKGSNAGAAYIFRKTGATWVKEAKIYASDAVADDRFGDTSAISGDRVIVGAWSNDAAGANAGAAYIFHKNGTTWTQAAKLRPSDLGAGDELGRSVAIDGSWAVVGSWRDDDAATDAGAAYVYQYTNNAWNQHGKLKASDGQPSDGFGWSVAHSNNRIIIGAFGNDDFGDSSGSAYLFMYEGTNWTQNANLTASSPEAGDNFGNSVAIENNIALIGAPGGSRINAATFSVTIFNDCNANGVPDECEIDNNNNGVPDSCETTQGDMNGDGIINVNDLISLLAAWGTCAQPCPPACLHDVSGPAGTPDCKVDIFDLFYVLSHWSG